LSVEAEIRELEREIRDNQTTPADDMADVEDKVAMRGIARREIAKLRAWLATL
jgi:hypothetical protein